MTIIEFFDRESAVENIAGALLYKPEKVVFIGNNGKRMKKSTENYKRVFDARKIYINFLFKTAGINNLNAIIKILEETVSENENCIIDLSGGDEFFLVAAGIVHERYNGRVQLHRFNIRNNTLIDCDSEGCIIRSVPLELSVEENVMIYGGRVIYNDEKPNTTYKWNFNDEFRADVHAIWSICKRNASAWNAQANVIAKLCNGDKEKSALKISAKTETPKEKLFVSNDIFLSLEKAGIIKELEISERLSFTFKNSQIMKCLTKAGQILELIVAVTAIELNENEIRLYNDIGSGVYIDWDGVVQSDNRVDVENEMDVILMKGMIPVFVSCKNGVVDSDELYKLSVVAERFGGKYVKKVLIASQLNEMGYRAEYIRARAADMNIKLIEDIDSMDDSDLRKTISKLWV